MSLKVGDKLPDGIEFQYIPIDLSTLNEASPLACSIPTSLKLDKLAEKAGPSGKIVIVSVPGAFTPTCTENHIPPYLTADHLKALKAKGVNSLVVISANDAFVLDAWGKLLLKDAKAHKDSEYPEIIFASDLLAEFSKKHDLSVDAGKLGLRTARYALVIDGNKEVKYAGKEVEKVVKYSGYDEVLAKL